MPATTANVGVRVFPSLDDTVVSIDTRDSTAIGLCTTADLADNDLYPLNTPVAINTADSNALGALGAGEALDAIKQIGSEGIVANVIFSRVAHEVGDTITAKIARVAGDSTSKTGLYALLNAKALTGLEPGILLAPGYTGSRPGALKNAAGAAMDAVATMIYDAVGITDGVWTDSAASIAFAADFAGSLRMMAPAQGVKVSLGGAVVVRSAAPHFAAAMAKKDKAVGNPFKASWNTQFLGVLGTSRPVDYREGDATCEANLLCQGGCAVIIEGNRNWGPFTTATDPTVKAWRSMKRIRTRLAIERALIHPLRAYLAQDVTPHLVTLLYTAVDEYLDSVQTLGAIVDHELVWDRTLNPATLLRDGGLRAKARWEDTPDLVDLGIYTEPMPEAYDVLQAAIAAALATLGDANIRVAA